MADSWEDWEKEDYTIPVLIIPNEERTKQLEERRLVEESDNALTRNLFSNEEEHLVYEKVKWFDNKFSEKKIPKKNVSSRQKENEQKQKEFSNKIKENKFKKEREKEIFGEATPDNEYIDYEDKFY
jgi:hypothetical protein